VSRPNSRLYALLRWLGERDYTTRLGTVLLLLVATCVSDFRTGFAVSIGFFYVVTVLLASYLLGPVTAMTIAVVAALAERYFLVPHDFATTVRLWNTVTRVGTFSVIIWLVTQLKQAFAAEQAAARHDFLTGLFNRRAFEERAEIELERCRRRACPLSILYIDCDDFKSVNDLQGHHEGDRVLQRMAEAMRANLRSTDVMARLGGDEFAALLPDSGESQARAAAEKLHAGLAAALSDGNHSLTCSLGAAVFAAVPESVEIMLRRADELMYKVKSSGKGAAQIDVFFER
jgi:diguanylate cyclase (GGDEF)-like protein